ncbi:MAG: O-antigen ligase family protein, partial [Vicinamibacterales bacterium]|nr:O-antigen ligase family protein [Vicinamibacterales bacterium]
NNRRLAFVGLAAGLVALVVLGPPSLLRFLKRSLVVLIPLALLYVAAGWNSTSGVFKPVGMIKSVASQEDDSSKTRDIENYNLIQTLKRNPLIGSGFGHEYHEVVRAHDVTEYFAQYKFIAHNSVLWLLAIGGWLGFAAVWAVFPIGLLIAIQVHRRTTNVVDRVTAMATVVMVACFVLQAWGDMGLQSWMGTLMVASLMGATGALHTRQQQMEIGR